jgi:hypothetical protein
MVEMAGEGPCQPQDVGIFSLRVPQNLDLRLQLRVHRSGRLTQLLVNSLT